MCQPLSEEVCPPVAWSLAEVKRVLSALPNDDRGWFVQTLITTGLRIGELIALRWSDVDLTTGVVSVRRTLSKSRTRQAIIRDGAKTRSGERKVLLLPTCTAMLTTHRQIVVARQANDPLWVDEDLVFPSFHGRPITAGTPKRWIVEAAEIAQVAVLRVHDLRHTHATILHALGIEERIIESRLGHKRPGMVARYTHIDVEAQRGAREALETALYGRTDTTLTNRPKRSSVIRTKMPVRSQKRKGISDSRPG